MAASFCCRYIRTPFGWLASATTTGNSTRVSRNRPERGGGGSHGRPSALHSSSFFLCVVRNYYKTYISMAGNHTSMLPTERSLDSNQLSYESLSNSRMTQYQTEDNSIYRRSSGGGPHFAASLCESAESMHLGSSFLPNN